MRAEGRGAERTVLLVVLLLGAALRLYPMHRPYLHPEQELIPRLAMFDTVRGDWRAPSLVYGTGLLYATRTLYTLWYAAARVLGVYRDRLDLFAAFVREPFPFVLGARLLCCLAGIATLWLVARLGRAIGGAWAGTAAAAFLAVGFIHVRESHHVWFDVPAGAAAVAAVLVALRAADDGRVSTSAAAGALAGLAVALKQSALPIVLPVALAGWWAGGGRPARAARHLGAAAAACVALFALLSPYAVLDVHRLLRDLRIQSAGTFAAGGESLPLATLVSLGIGPAVALLALVGLAVSAWRAPATTAVVAAFPLASLALLVASARLYARYLAPLAPFAAVFAGVGAVALGTMLGRGRAAPVMIGLVLLAAAGPALQSVRYDALLARADTRQLAGDWIRAHVPPGTRVTLPSRIGYPNPLLPWNSDLLLYREFAAALRARGVGDPREGYPQRYLAGMFGGAVPGWEPSDPVVVTADHPVLLPAAATPPEHLARLRAAGARPVATFAGVPEPLDARVVYDPVDADYVPLAGCEAVLRPGPNITIWELP